MQEYITAISTVGFPIVACIALYYNNLKQSEAINNNTLALNKLAEKMDCK